MLLQIVERDLGDSVAGRIEALHRLREGRAWLLGWHELDHIKALAKTDLEKVGEREGAVIPSQFIGGIHGPPRAGGDHHGMNRYLPSSGLGAVWRGLWSCHSVWGWNGVAEPGRREKALRAS